MRLHSAKVQEISHQMVHSLTSTGDIETDSPKEVELDVQAVLNQFITDEQEVTEKAKDVLAQRGLPQTELNRIRKLLADERKIKLGDDAIDYLLDQLVEMLMHSANVEEIFAEDFELRRKLRDPLRKQAAVDQEIDVEVRSKIKHVKEGTAVWEVEYRRMMDDIRRRKGL
jgi:hypothetical protein